MRKFYSNKIKAVPIFLFLFALLNTLSVAASHFRFGLMTATRVSETATTVTYRLNVSTSWRLGTTGSGRYQITGGNSGFVDIPMTFTTDPSGQWANGSGSVNVTLNKSATPTRIEWISGGKISNTVNNHDMNWDVYVILNTANPGSSPVSSLPAIINMPINATAATYTIPASDPDPGSTLTFGTPNFTSGGLTGQSNPSGFSFNSTTGQITLNTVGKTIGQLYNAMVTVTDNHGNQIMMDFIIQMVGPSTAPVFDYSVTPTNGFVYNVISGQNITFPVKATDGDAGSSVGLSVSGLPSYISMANFSPAMPAAGNPSQTTFNWTPTAAQVGHTVVLNFIATDNVGVQTTTSVTLKVLAEPAPVFVNPTPIEGTTRQIPTGVPHQDVIKAESSLGSNISFAFTTKPSGATLSTAIPSPAVHPATTTLSWTPNPANWGEHTVSFQAVIASAPTIFATRTYTLIVNTPPAFTSSPVTSARAGEVYTYNITVSDPDQPYGDALDILGGTLPSWLTLTDNGNGTATLSGTPTVAHAGPHTIHLHAEDIYHHGPQGHVEQEFTINVVACNTNVVTKNTTVFLDGNGHASITAADVDNGSTAECGIQSISVSPSSFSCTNLGANTVTLSVTNNQGLTYTKTATVTVVDNMAPVPYVSSLPTITGECSASVSAPTATDNCGGSITGTTTSPTTYTAQGTYTVTWTYTDGKGNASTQTQSVIVKDETPPTITCPEPITVNNDANTCGAVVNYTTPVASDNCAGPNGSQTFTYSGSIVNWTVPAGVTSVTIKASGARGGNSTGSFYAANGGKGASIQGDLMVTPGEVLNILVGGHGADALNNTNVLNTGGGGASYVWRNTSPLIVAGGGSGAGTCGSQPGMPGLATLGGPGAGGLGGSLTCGINNGGGGGAGWFSNGSGTPANLSIGGLSPMNGGLGGVAGIGDNYYAGTAGGFGGGAGGGGNCGGPGGGGGYTGGNGGDNILCSGGQKVSGGTSYNIGTNQANLAGVNADHGSVVITWTSAALPVAQISGLPSGAEFPVGTTTNTFEATDAAGNKSTCSFDVTVTDGQAPTVATQNLTVQLDANGQATITPVQINNNSSDNCSIPADGFSLDVSSFDCSNVGANTVTLTVTDVHGNKASNTAVVTVQDNRPPAVLTKNITVYLDAQGAAVISEDAVNNGSNDACGGLLYDTDKTSFNCSNVGSNTVTLTVTDLNGNSATATAVVTVKDEVAPVVVTQNITVQLDAAGKATITAAQVNNGSTDACGIASVTLDKASFNCSNVGTNTVTLTVTDVNGNSANETAIVTVQDNIPPAVVTKNINVYLNAQGSVTISEDAVNNGSADACGGLTFDTDVTSFNCSSVGANTVTLTVTDAHGNSASQTATVTVSDNTAPTVATKNITIYLDATGNASITPEDVDNGSSDICGIASRTLSQSSFTCAKVGTNTVTLTVVDINGNTASASAIVTVMDKIDPNVIPKNVTVTLLNGAASITPADINNGSTDACGIKGMSLSKTSFDCTNIGSNTVTLTVTDNNGNEATATATVTVVGVIPSPAITVSRANTTYTGPGNEKTIFLGYGAQSLNLTASDANSAGTAYSWSPATYLNSAAGATVSYAPDASQEGDQTLTVLATNQYGCFKSASVSIKVVEARCGTGLTKVNMCHVAGNDATHVKTICIDGGSVHDHLVKGCKIGVCPEPGTVVTGVETEVIVNSFALKAMPNPSTAYFTLKVETGNLTDKISLRIMDVKGRLVEMNGNVQPNQTLRIGDNYRPGIYFVEVIQGAERKQTKLVKMSN